MTTTSAEPLHFLASSAEQTSRSLAGDVEAALWGYAPLRASGARVSVTAAGGRVTLAGRVRSSTHKAMAERLAAAVAEVTEVENRLIADNELETRVSAALAADASLSAAAGRVLAKCLYGTVYLDGRIVAADASEATAVLGRMVEAAAAVQGVDRVISRAHA